MGMNYGSWTPEERRQQWSKRLNNIAQQERDKRLARNVQMYRGMPETIDIDTVTRIEGSGGNANIQAKIVAKGAVPPTTDVKAAEEDFKQFQIAVGFYVNEREMAQDPGVKNTKIDWCYRQIGRLEDYIYFNGDSTINLSGLQTHAEANTNGKIVASGASGSDANNVGSWDGTDTNIDIQKDLLQAIRRLGDNYQNAPKYLIGRAADLMYIRQLDDMRQSYYDEVVDLMGTSDFLRSSAYTPSGYVYLVAKDAEVSEFTASTEMMVDNDYPKEKGGNYWVEVREWINPFQLYDNTGMVEIAIG